MLILHFSISQIALSIVSILALSVMLFKFAEHADLSKIRWIHPVFQARLVSSIIFCLPVYVCGKVDYFNYLKIDFISWPAGIPLTVIFAGMAICVSYHIARRSVHLSVNLQLRTNQWSSSLLIRNGLSWIIYLLGYEILFRGFLLFSALKILPVTSAITVNLIIYSAAHFHKGWMEIMMAVPFGLLLCLITLYTGNFWSAFIIHTSLALGHDWFAVKMQSTVSSYNTSIIP